MKIAILCVSDRSSRGQREDLGTPAIEESLNDIAEVSEYKCVPDNFDLIVKELILLSKIENIDLIFTTGGTGIAPSDVTVEATLQIGEKEIPGIAEAMRIEGMKKTPMAMLSRATAVVLNQKIIINLPGSPKACRENIVAIKPILEHASKLVKSQVVDCQKDLNTN